MITSGEQLNNELTIASGIHNNGDRALSDTPVASAFDVFRVLRNRKRLGLAVLCVVLAGGVPIALEKGKPVYRVEATIYVSPAISGNPSDDRERDPSHYKSFVQHETRRLVSNDVLERAIGKLSKIGTQWMRPGKSMAETIEKLHKILQIEHVPETYEIQVALQGNEKSGLAETVNMVAQTYIDATISDEKAVRTEKVTALTHERERLYAELDAKTKNQARLLHTLGTASFGAGASSPDDRTLAEYRDKLAEAKHARIEAEAQLAAFDSSGWVNSVSSSPEDLLSPESNVKTESATLRQRLSELRARDLGAKHPSRKSIEDQIARLQDELRAAETAARGRARAKLEAEVMRFRRVEGAVNADIRAQEEQLPAMTDAIYGATDLNGEIIQLRAAIAAVDHRIGVLELDSKGAGSVRLFSAAETPIWPIKGGRRKPIAAALAASLLLAFGSMIAADALSQKIQTSGAIERIVGFSPVGILMNEEPEAREFAQEQLLRLVTGIQRSQRSLGAKTFVLTPVGSQGTGSDVAAKLAAILRMNGTKVLVIDANALRPADAALPAAAVRQGLADFLSLGAIAWPLADQGSGPADYVGLGNTFGKPRLPEMGRLQGLLADLSKKYEMVLVSGPPLLMSADAEQLVSICDATLLVVEAGRATRGQVKKAVQRLTYLRPTRIGAILNQASLKHSDEALRVEAREYAKSLKMSRIGGLCA